MENRAHFLSTPYEPSLHELIDIMAKKKLEWERKMEALETRMAIRDQELANAQNKLDQRGQEVLNRDPLLLIKKKTQTFHLWSYYEKLQWHQVKQDRVHSKKKSTENQETPFELSNLNQKLEEFKAKSREWDKQETLCQNQLVSLDAQRKLLSEKCNLFQRQTQNYQIQISSKKEKQEEGSSCSQAKVEHLRVQPDISNETPDRDEVFIEKLKLTVHEIALSKNKLQKQNLELQKELKVYQRQCQVKLFSKNVSLCLLIKNTNSTMKNKSINFLQQTIDLSNKEHESYTVSIHMLECENERLQNDPVKLQGDTEAPVLTNLDMYEAAKHTSQPQISMQEKEERPCPTTATEKFLQEEEKRAMEFEKILNSHIEELQRHSENTLKKYTNLRQS
uniref:Deuterosome assembly protein 1 n=1 Tax=Sphenodon punctatus TaxID=8508 RepID=A0A8D0HL10_SPHPU